jgi:glycosyltransferase involved in cell wall biosynthesis
LRIALISSEFSGLLGSGGIGTYFDHLARGLVQAGCEVEVFTSGRVGDLPEREGILYHHLGKATPPDFAVFAGLAFRERHQQKPFDVLECGELKAEGAWAARWVKDVAFVMRLHSPSVILNRYLDFPLAPWSYAKKIFFQLTVALGARRRGLPMPPIYLEPFAFVWNQSADFQERAMAQSANMVLVMNEEMERFASGAWGIARNAVKIRPNPFFPKDLKQTSTSSEQKVIGFIGRLEPRKGVVELAKALCQVLPDFPEWKVKLAGSSTGSCVSGKDPAAVVKKQLARFGDQIEFQDRIEPSDVQDWFDSVGLCVFPSIWETFSYVTLEAAQAGKAIIGTRTGAVPEILDEGQAGLIVPPGDVKELAEALRKLMADDELRRSLGGAAKKRFEESFHPDRVMGEILEVYREAIKRARERVNRQNH